MVSASSAGVGHFEKSASGIDLRLAAESMIDGSTALTRMPSPVTSAARLCVIIATAAFDALYATMPAVGTTATRAATLTMRPPALPFLIVRTASRHDRKQVPALIFHCASNA